MTSDDPRLRRVEALWRWLPAFRVVAEVGHLGQAAGLLAVSRSALSRTVRLVEEALGVPVFVRERGRLVLNEHGEALLTATRVGMRRVDDVLALLQSTSAGVVRLGYDERTAFLQRGSSLPT